MIESMLEHGFRYEFFQAVRMLYQLYPDREPVGYDAAPAREAVRFGAHVTFSFPASQIHEVMPGQDDEAPLGMKVNFMGLTGPLGVLPHRYTEILLERARVKDFTLDDFLNIFNHRFIALFYRAWEKYHFPVAYEQARDDRFSRYLSCLIGMGTGGLQGRLAVEDQGLLLYAGLLNQRPRSACALESILRDYFGMPFEVRQFEGRWIRLGDENRTGLGLRNATLGASAVLGASIWDQGSKFRVRVGPIGLDDFNRFLPGGEAYEQLVHLTRFYAGIEHDFDVQLILRAGEVPACRLVSGRESASRLGWSSWIKTGPCVRDASDTVLQSAGTG